HLIPSKIKDFVNKKIKEIKEEFAKKYSNYGPIDSWTCEELIMDGFDYLSRFSNK
ncbi:13496_t:CDS:1, partial [Funneliformis geosporum]